MPRCPNGSRRHPPKTGVCVKNSEKPKSTKNKTQKRIKKTKSDSLSTTEIKSVIKEFSDDLDDDDFFTASDKKKSLKMQNYIILVLKKYYIMNCINIIRIMDY